MKIIWKLKAIQILKFFSKTKIQLKPKKRNVTKHPISPTISKPKLFSFHRISRVMKKRKTIYVEYRNFKEAGEMQGERQKQP